MILAEGIALDARGAFTLVGLNQNVYATDSLPSHTKRAVLTRIVDLTTGSKYRIRVEVASPNGRVIAVQEGQFEVAGLRIPGIPPGGADIPNEFQIAVTEFGTYRFVAELTDDASGHTESATIELYAVRASEYLLPDEKLAESKG
jgi:hypothetical protein